MTLKIGKTVLAQRIKTSRTSRGLTLTALARRAGLSTSTLSKVEAGTISLSYTNVEKVAAALGTSVSALFDPAKQNAVGGRRSIARNNEGAIGNIPGYKVRKIADELISKRLHPMIVTVKARSIEEAGGLKRHAGEEVYYIVFGSVTLLTDLYAPVDMEPGDCIYMDGTMGHAFIGNGKDDAVIFVVTEGHPIFDEGGNEVVLQPA